MEQEDAANEPATGLDSLPQHQALRLELLRIAADIAPKPSGGAKAEDVVAKAETLELYVMGPPKQPAAQAAVAGAEPERGAPEPDARQAGPRGRDSTADD
jgi:hypothetical protein